MNNCVENFANYNTIAPSYYYPTPVHGYGYNQMNGSRSPDFLAAREMCSPSNMANSHMYGYERTKAASPVINLMPCVNLAEQGVTTTGQNPLDMSLKKLSLRSKLSYKSKAFVKKDAANKGERKPSQDTKAHSEDDGNSSDDSDDMCQRADDSTLRLSKANTVGCKTDVATGCFTSLDEKPQVALQAKFKTELCKNWQAGDCKFGSKCSFAHGIHELTEKKHLPSNYKTKVCKQFHEELYCSYGARCQFIHLENIEKAQVNELASAIYSLAGLNTSKKAYKNRLSVFKNITN